MILLLTVVHVNNLNNTSKILPIIIKYVDINAFEKFISLLPQNIVISPPTSLISGSIRSAPPRKVTLGLGPMHLIEAASLIFGKAEFENVKLELQKVTKQKNNELLSVSTKEKLLHLMEATEYKCE